jgi:hypothetical protein
MLLLLAAGCSPAPSQPIAMQDMAPLPAPPPPALVGIEVQPATAMLTTTATVPATQHFSATARYADGHTADVTAAVTWRLGDNSMGSVSAGSFIGPAARGGTTTVEASDGTFSGAASLTVRYVANRVASDDGSTAPASSPALFTGADNPALAPLLAYPLDGARLPHNLGLLDVQWGRPTAAATLFEVSFTSATLDYRVYTNALLANGGRVSLTPAEWWSIADSNRGGTVAIKVRGAVQSQPGAVGSSAVATIRIDNDDVQGGIYYWVPQADNTSAGFIERHAFGDASAPSPPYYAPAAANGTPRCVGCHVITRDGKRMALTYDGGDGPAAELSVSSLSDMIAEAAGDKWDFASFSPDGTRLVASSAGTLKIYDASGGAANGTAIETLASGANGQRATHPDWSPDGKKIVYVVASAPPGTSDWDLEGGSLAVATDLGMGVFGAPTLLVKSTGENNYYPSFSPDGRWILFNRARSGGSYNNPTAELFVISADGAVGPIALAAANASATGLTNSWPRWSPFVQHQPGGGDLLYFTFSSTRDYGIELEGAKQPQIWMAAFDAGLAATGSDPSSVSFWLPFQDVKSHNHIAQWTTTIVPIQ